MVRRICVHLGPHKTGSTAIQKYLEENSEVLKNRYATQVYSGADLGGVAEAFRKTDWVTAQNELLILREKILKSNEEISIITSEDLSGNLPGRNGTRRVYPRLSEQINLIRKALPEFSCEFYFFVRAKERWIQSVYAQNLRFRQTFTTREQFDNFLKFDGDWHDVLKKAQHKHGAVFTTIDYEEGGDFSAEAAFLEAIDLPLGNDIQPPPLVRQNLSASESVLDIFEVINGSHSSTHAKKTAKTWLSESPTPEETIHSPEDFPIWPPSAALESVPPGLKALASRVKARVYTQHEEPWVLPEPDLDFSAIRTSRVIGPDEFPGGNRQDMHQQKEILRFRFRGLPEVCYIVGFAISYLRRDTAHTDKARCLFHRAWTSEYPLLLATLPTRWLISSMQTFLDHGSSSQQRIVGSAGYFLSNILKAYEAERALEGLQPNSIYPETRPSTQNGFRGMDRFTLGGTDLMVNTLALLLELAVEEPISGRVVQEFLLRMKKSNTIFSRMDQSRIAHQVTNPQFDNCWSFFEPP